MTCRRFVLAQYHQGQVTVPRLVTWRYDFTILRRTRVKFILGMAPPGDLDGLSHAKLKGLVVKQWEEMVELQRMVAALRDEIARLKGGPGRPNIKPSGTAVAGARHRHFQAPGRPPADRGPGRISRRGS